MAAIPFSKAEKSYIQTGLALNPPQRPDGRSLHDYRTVALETGVAPLANGSAKLNIGRNPQEGGGGTEIIAATKLEVEDVEDREEDGAVRGVGEGRIVVNVTCSPAAYPHLASSILEDFQEELSTLLSQTLSHPTLRPKNLAIIPGKRAWMLALDLLILSDAGNVYDALFMAARAALCDTKVPRTRLVEMQVVKKGKRAGLAGGRGETKGIVDDVAEDMDVDASGLDTRQYTKAQDFDLPDYWDEGEELEGKERWPVAVTLNVASSVYFLDATLQEEASIPLKVLVAVSHQDSQKPLVQATRILGTGELQLDHLNSLIKDGMKHAGEIYTALNAKLKDEDIRRYTKERQQFVTGV